MTTTVGHFGQVTHRTCLHLCPLGMMRGILNNLKLPFAPNPPCQPEEASDRTQKQFQHGTSQNLKQISNMVKALTDCGQHELKSGGRVLLTTMVGHYGQVTHPTYLSRGILGIWGSA